VNCCPAFTFFFLPKNNSAKSATLRNISYNPIFAQNGGGGEHRRKRFWAKKNVNEM